MRIIKFLFTLLILSAIAFAGGGFFLFTNHWIDVSVLEHYNPGKPSIVFDNNEKEWFRFQLDRRDPIKLNTMPRHLINAFLAAEDWHFFSHCGLSFKGIVRSALKNLYHGRRVQGASTITQQLVKLLYFDTKKTFTRKLKEQLYALIIEQQFTKEQILEIYLNHVYFGCGIYGVEAAAQRFWNKPASEISIDQAATLAAIIRNPSQYCPLLYPLSNERRRNIVLHSMRKINLITPDEYQTARNEPVEIITHNAPVIGPHVQEWLRMQLEELVGKQQLYSGGLTIQTTIDTNTQQIAQKEFNVHCKKLREEFEKKIDGGLLSVEVQTGEIRAMIGGLDFSSSKFNRAMQARRQMGSVFKPVVYAAAMQKGMSFADVEIDEPIQVTQEQSVWSPNNFNRRFNGPITRAYALSHSNNIVTIKTLLNAGVDNVIAIAKRSGIEGPFFPYPSLALGCVDGTLKEAAGMFNLFANDGVYVEPHLIKWIKNRWGTKIYKQSVKKERVLASRVVSQVNKVLSLGIQRASKWYKNWIDCEAISKTGTTNDSRSSWYIGATPTLTTAIYIGCDDNQSIGRNVYPIRTAFPIWLSLNRQLKSPIKQFTYDPSLHTIVINEKSGNMCYRTDREAIEILV